MADLSKDLKPIYELELQLGNEVLRVDSPAGTTCPLAVIFRDPLHFDEINRHLNLSPSAVRWSNSDSHYPVESGYYSSVSRHAIAGPQA